MDNLNIPGNWLNYVVLGVGGFLWWLIRGYVRDVKELRESHMPRAEIVKALADQQHTFATLLSNHQTGSDANFREVRARLDTLNDTLLKVALK